MVKKLLHNCLFCLYRWSSTINILFSLALSYMGWNSWRLQCLACEKELRLFSTHLLLSLKLLPVGRMRKALDMGGSLLWWRWWLGWVRSPTSFWFDVLSFLTSVFCYLKWETPGVLVWDYNNLCKVPESWKKVQFFSCYYTDVHLINKWCFFPPFIKYFEHVWDFMLSG